MADGYDSQLHTLHQKKKKNILHLLNWDPNGREAHPQRQRINRRRHNFKLKGFYTKGQAVSQWAGGRLKH